MSAYVKATNFATKDTLPTGDANKIVKGTEIDNEFNAIAGAISSKADLASPTFTGSPAAPTATAGSNTTQIANTSYVRGELTTLIPTGIITLWSGAISGIPSGWVLCNGSNSTPDLRDRFVVGAGTTYAVGATGGANSVTLDSTMIPSHTHSVTASGTTSGHSNDHTHTVTSTGTTSTVSNDHSHTFSGTTSGQSNTHSHGVSDPGHAHGPGSGSSFIGNPNQGGSGRTDGAQASNFAATAAATTNISIGGASADHSHTYSGTTSGISANHTHTVSVSGTSAGVSSNHTHTVTVTGTSGGTGGGLAHENRPPYYALAWIMKL